MKELVIYLVCAIIAMLGLLNYSLMGIFDVNLIKFTKHELLTRLMYTIIGIAGIYLLTKRKFFLPFLGETVMPPFIIKEYKQTKYDLEIPIDVPNDVIQVVYWAANPNIDTINVLDAMSAYKGFENSGVSPATNGKSKLYIKCPQRYKVGLFKKILPKHLHYRYVYPNGIISSVETLNLSNKCLI